MVICSGAIRFYTRPCQPVLPREPRLRRRRTLSIPVFGCSPRPLNRLGGSTLKLPTFSFLPSNKQYLNGSSNSSFCVLRAFFSSFVSDFFFSRSISK